MRRTGFTTIHGARRREQRGMMLVLFTIAMVATLGMVGMALDGSHGMLNKTRLQNTVDAAALSAAKTLDQTDDQVLATSEAYAMFSQNAAGLGNAEMAASYAAGDLNVSVQYSTTLHPFVPATVPPRYVRVTARNLRLPGWFIPIMGFNEKIVGASAVAGPSPTINTACNLAPMMVCGDPNAPPQDNFGYEIGEPDVLKQSTSTFEVGPGNFQLIRLGGGQGGAVVREAMAGNYQGCLSSDDSIPTEPGNTVGPVVQGLNTRLGQYSGPMNGSQSEYPPDVVVEAPDPLLEYECPAAGDDSDLICYNGVPLDGAPDPDFYDYEEYNDAVADGAYDYYPIEEGGSGVFGRRILAVPIGDCTNTTNGQGEVPLLGFLCYHLLQPAVQKGNESHVYGEFIGDGCRISGRPGPNPGTGPGPYVIQLYKDETAPAS
jgi:Flp pilus assembly protein TadG